MLSQLQIIKAIRSAPAQAAIVHQSRSVLPGVAGVVITGRRMAPAGIPGDAPDELRLVANRRSPVGESSSLTLLQPILGSSADDPAVLALSPSPEATLPQVDALACLDQEIEDSVRFSGHAALVTDHGGLVGLLTLENIQAAILTRLIARERTAIRHDLMVAQMMTRWDSVPVIERAWMSFATIEDVLWIFSRSDATHLVVVDSTSLAVDAVYGWISRIELLRRLDCR